MSHLASTLRSQERRNNSRRAKAWPRTMVVAALAISVLWAQHGAADEVPVVDPAAKARVQHLLNGYERIPKPAELIAVENLDRILEAIWNDSSQPAHIRARALSSFSVLPPNNERARKVLTQTLADEKVHPIFRRVAIKSWVTLKGASALAEVKPALSHAELAIRSAAVEALTPFAAKNPAVKEALATRVPREGGANREGDGKIDPLTPDPSPKGRGEPRDGNQ